MPNTQIDVIDCAILEALQERGDLPNVDLARRVGLSPAAALRRVQHLRAEGVIGGVRAVVDPQHVGAGLQAFIMVALSEHGDETDARFAEALEEVPAVLRADAISGSNDVLLHIAAADTAELQSVLRLLPRIGARRVTTMLRLGTVKASAATPVRPSSGSRPPRR